VAGEGVLAATTPRQGHRRAHSMSNAVSYEGMGMGMGMGMPSNVLVAHSHRSNSNIENHSVNPTSKNTKTAPHDVEFHTSKVRPLPEIKVNGTILKVVEEFKYLGSTENDDAALDTEVDRRIYAMKRAFYMDYILLYRRKSITLRARMQMFIAKVTADAVYGCAAWNYTQRHLAKLESTYFRLLKCLIRMKKP
jgi:hypothetical protein